MLTRDKNYFKKCGTCRFNSGYFAYCAGSRLDSAYCDLCARCDLSILSKVTMYRCDKFSYNTAVFCYSCMLRHSAVERRHIDLITTIV